MNEDLAITAVEKAISELVIFDLVLVENGNAPPSTYIQNHRHEYFGRCVIFSRPCQPRVALFVCWKSVHFSE